MWRRRRTSGVVGVIAFGLMALLTGPPAGAVFPLALVVTALCALVVLKATVIVRRTGRTGPPPHSS